MLERVVELVGKSAIQSLDGSRILQLVELVRRASAEGRIVRVVGAGHSSAKR